MFKAFSISFFIGALMLWSGCKSTTSKPTLECYSPKITSSKPIDENSKCWKNIPRYTLQEVTGYHAHGKVTVQFAHDSQNLYFRFDAQDDDIFDESPDTIKNGLYLYGDTIELFIRPQNSRGYWEFHFSASGKFGAIHFPARGKRMPSSVKYIPMEGLTFSRTIIGTYNNSHDKDERWIGLAKIPFAGLSSMGGVAASGDTLTIQISNRAYSVHADQDDIQNLNVDHNLSHDPHYLPLWVPLKLK